STAKTTTLARGRLGQRDHDVTLARTGDGAFHHQQVLVQVDAANAQIAYRHLLCPEVPRHTLPGENPRGERGSADRTLHLEHVSVSLGATTKVMAADHTGKPASLAGA